MPIPEHLKQVAGLLYKSDGTPLNQLQQLAVFAFDANGNALGPGVAIDADPGAEKSSATPADWTAGTNWAFAGTVCTHTAGATATLSLDASEVANEIYRVVFPVAACTAGSVTVSIGGVSGTARSSNTTFTEFITATGTGNLTFTPSSDFDGNIDIASVSVKRVGVAAADRVTAWVGDRVASGVEAAGDAGIFGRTEDGTKFFLGDRFGFGTWEPGYFLDVRGALNIAPSTSPAGIDQGIRLADPGTGASEGLFIQWESADRADMARVWAEGDTTGGILVFSTNAANTGTSTARMRIKPSGALLINASAAYADNGQLLEVNKSADDGGIGLFCWSTTDAERALLEFHKSSSATIGTKALVADEEAAGGIIWKVADGAVNWSPIVSIEGFVDTAPGAGDTGGRLVFSTTADGAASVTERMRIDSAGYMGLGTLASAATLFEAAEVKTITGAVTDGYSGALTLDPGYTAATALTVTRHNYIDVNDVSNAGAGPSAVTDACVLRFDAAAGTHKATVGATTKTTPGGVDGWMKVNINGTIYYMPMYTSTTA